MLDYSTTLHASFTTAVSSGTSLEMTSHVSHSALLSFMLLLITGLVNLSTILVNVKVLDSQMEKVVNVFGVT
jgi:hypothetical protein